jgi:hypothetical protein
MYFIGNRFSPNSDQLPVGKYKEDLIWQLDADYLKQVYEKYKKRMGQNEWKEFCLKHEKLVSICENIQEDDNPILMRIKIKLK